MALAQKPRKNRRSPPAKPAAAKNPTPRRPAAKRPARADDADDDDEPGRSSPAMAEVDAAALEFIEALDRFKKQHGRPFPSWSEVLYVLRELGYKKG